jgi:putative lumazine-binding protein
MHMRTTLLFITLALAAVLAPAADQTDPESAAIRQTALDYIDGWYTGDAARMEHALHPDLAKRIVNTDPKGGWSTLGQQSAMGLVLGTRSGAGKRPESQRQEDVTILDHFQNVAMVKIVANDWVDYLQVAKFNGQWKIVNVLWEMKARPTEHSK